MIRVLHVVAADVDASTRQSLAQLAAAGSITWDRLDLSADGAAAMLRLLRLRRERPAVQLLHAVGLHALPAAMAVDCPILFSPGRPPDRKLLRWLRAVGHYRRLDVVVSTETDRRFLIERGLPMERCHVVAPGVDFGRIRPTPELRERLEFTPEDRIVLAVGESTRAADHLLAVWSAVILHVLDRRFRVLVWGRGPMAGRVRRFAESLQQPELCVIATDRLGPDCDFESLAGVADVAMVTAAGPVSTLPIAQCMASGLPLVSVTDSTICELLEDRHNAWLCTTRRPRDLARRVLDALDDPQTTHRLVEQARGEAYERYRKTVAVTAMVDLVTRLATATS